MIDPALLMHDSLSDPAFQKALHQNNLYMFQECMRSAPGNAASDKLLKVQGVLETVAKSTVTSPTLAQQIQDALAAENIYLDIPHIETYFIDATTSKIKDNLINKTSAEVHDAAWGQLVLQGMKDSVAGYNAHKESKSTTKEAYIELEKHLKTITVRSKTMPSTDKSRHDIWVDIEKTGTIAKDEAKDDYMANFAKKAGFTKQKIERHHDYLDTEFFLLSTNHWWQEKDATSNDYKAQSHFRDQKVLVKNATLAPQCLVRVSQEPRRGTINYQPTAQRRTIRMDLKNSPFHMSELAAFMNLATDAKFPAAPAGTDPTSAVSKLAGKDNPFHDAVFKIGTQWYILGAAEANGTLVVQKRAITVTPPTGVPTKDPATGKYSNITLASVGGLLSVNDLASAQGVDGKALALAELVENGVKKLVTDCGFAVSVNNAPLNDGIGVGAVGDQSPVALFKLDDRALLMQWLLTPGLDLATDKKVQEAVFGTDAAVSTPLVAAMGAANTAATPAAKQAALAPVFEHLHKNPQAYAALATESAKAAAKDPHAVQLAAIRNRGKDPDAFRKALKLFDKAAFREVFWGAVLAKCLELSEKMPPLDPDDVRNQLSEMVKRENDIFAVSGVNPYAAGGIAENGNLAGSDLADLLNEIHKNYNNAHAAVGSPSGSALLQSQRDEVARAFAQHASNDTPEALQGKLLTNGISLAAADLIAKPVEKPFTAADKSALEAIKLVATLFDVQKALIANPAITVADLQKVADDAFVAQFDAFGGKDKITYAAGSASSPQQLVDTLIDQYHNAVAGSAATTHLAANLPGLQAIDAIVKAGGTPLNPNQLATATFHASDLEQVNIFRIQQALLQRRSSKETACGFQEIRAIASDGSEVFEAASADQTDYVSMGLMHWRAQNPTGYIDVKTIDGRAVRWEQCAPPVGQSLDHVYYHFTIENNGKREVFAETREEGRHLRNQVLDRLKTHADDALKQSAGQGYAGVSHTVMPDPDNPKDVHEDKVPAPDPNKARPKITR